MLSALIGAIGVIIGALIQTFGKQLIEIYRFRRSGFPNIEGQWRGEWYVLDVLDNKVKEDRSPVEDIIEIKKRGYKIHGKGKHPLGTYYLKGQYSLSGIITLVYEYKDVPHSLSGVIIFKIDLLGKKLSGYWYGYTSSGIIKGGKVYWRRI